MAGSRELEIAIRISGRVEKSFKSALGAVSKGLGSITKVISSATTAAASAMASMVGTLGTAAVNVGKEFEGAMSQVAATMLIDKTTAEGQKAFETLENAARECGATTAFSATEAAEALNYLALAGYDAEKAATALPTVLKLAGAGAMDLGSASDMVTDSMSALGIEATEENLKQFSDQLAQTASKANTSVSQLGEAILTVGGTAKGLAGDTVAKKTAQLNTALGILADNGLKGAEGGTHLRNIILSLQSPTDKAAKALQELGVETYDSKGRMRGLNEIFKDLQGAMSDMNNAQKDSIISTLFNKTDLAAANALLSNCSDRFDELSASIENSAGACENMYAIQLDNLEGDIKILQSGLQDLGISVYKDLNKPLREMTQLATRMVGKLSEAYKSGGMEGMVGAVGDCLAEVVDTIADYAPKVMNMGIDLLRNFIGGITKNSGKIANAAADVIAAFIRGIFDLLPQVILAGVDIITQLAQGLISQLPQLIHNGALAVVNFVNGIIQRLPDIIATALALIRALVTSLAENAPMLIQSGIRLIISLVHGLLSNLGNILQTAVQIVVTLALGLIQGIPQLLSAIPRLIVAIIDAILSTNWIEVGIQIVKGIIDGILSTGKGLWNAVKSLFTGGKTDIPKNSSKGAAFADSFTSGISSSAGKATAAADSMAANAFGSLDTGGAIAAGTQAGTAFSAGLNTGVNTGMSGINTNNVLNTADLSAEMTMAGINDAMSLTSGFYTGLTQNMDMGMLDSSGVTDTLTNVGMEGANAVGAGMAGNSQTVAQASEALGNDVNTALDDGWNQANMSAQTAMQQLTETVTNAANAAANAIKSAFENMTITIPKPKIPDISVSAKSIPYGNGGSVSIPKFSVEWNAAGGIFNKPTIFNTQAGMQGVGEAGAEAVLPLDTLWAKMREILNEAVAANSGTSLIDAFIEKLKGMGTGSSGNAPELAGAGGPTIQYSPVYNLYGNAGKDDIVEADRMSQAEFNKMMRQYERDYQRRKL